MNIKVIFEDKNMLAIDKPAGLVVHSDGKTDEPSVSDWVSENYPDLLNVGEPWTRPDGTVLYRPGIVHRIDRETSGVLLICKTNKFFAFMKEKFQNREVSKTYHAFVYGVMPARLNGVSHSGGKQDEGTIDRPIARSRKDFRLWSAQRGARGELRVAITDYKVLKRGKDCTYVEVVPKTGRTHQIRVHFKAINFPIVCDRLYAPKRKSMLEFKRLALHASVLSFDGMNGKTITIEAPFPTDFEKALRLIEE